MEELLDRHNKYRCMHKTPLLEWDAEVAAMAQRHADKGQMGHSSRSERTINGESCGENIAWGMPTYSGLQSTDAWYDEIKNTPGGKGKVTGFGGGTGHYTQVVWKGSTKIGCGRGKANNGDLWVCQYCPAGNFMGKYEQNVLPLAQSEAECADAGGNDIEGGANPSPSPPPPKPEEEKVEDNEEEEGPGPVCSDNYDFCSVYRPFCSPYMRVNGMPIFDACKRTCDQCPSSSASNCVDTIGTSTCRAFKFPYCNPRMGGYIMGKKFTDACKATCGLC